MSAGFWSLLLFAAGSLPALVRRLYPPLPAARMDAERQYAEPQCAEPQCVVVLGAGVVGQGERRRCTAAGLRRLVHAVSEARARGLPLLISGGGRHADRGEVSEARLLAQLAEGFGLTVWLEERSRNTRENARNSAAVLAGKGVRRALLVTDRAHMTRAVLCFRQHDLEVESASLDRLPDPPWLPSAAALALLPEIWYEWLALLWYQLRDGL